MKEGNFWSSWSPFEKGNRFTYLSLEETLVGGQCFDWHEIQKSHWRGKIVESVVECRWKNNRVEWRCGKKKPLDELKIKEYFWLGEDYDEAVRTLPCRSDPVLEKCVEKLQGLRILRQPLDQSLFFFLLSSAKSIPQIQAVGKAVFQKYGDRLFEDIYSFPGWDRLAEIPESELRSLKLGYRAKYVAESARFISSRSDWLESIPKMSYENAKRNYFVFQALVRKWQIVPCFLEGIFWRLFLSIPGSRKVWKRDISYMDGIRNRNYILPRFTLEGLPGSPSNFFFLQKG